MQMLAYVRDSQAGKPDEEATCVNSNSQVLDIGGMTDVDMSITSLMTEIQISGELLKVYWWVYSTAIVPNL